MGERKEKERESGGTNTNNKNKKLYIFRERETTFVFQLFTYYFSPTTKTQQTKNDTFKQKNVRVPTLSYCVIQREERREIYRERERERKIKRG